MMRKSLIMWLSSHRLVVLLAALVIFLTLSGEGFWGIRNLQNLATMVSIEGIMVVGMTVVMIGRGFDLSVGSVMALSGVIAISLQPLGLPVATVLALAAAATAGVANGLLITQARVNPFIATFGTMIVIRGLVMTITDGQPAVGVNYDFMELGRGRIFGFPIPAVILAVLLLLGHFLLVRTRFGRHVYALGGNEESARLSGISTNKAKVATYVLCSLTAGIAGIVLASRLNTGSPIIGENTALNVIAAVLLGGTTLSGGVGTMTGSLAGLLTIGVLGNGLNLLEIPVYYQRVALGVLLVGLVVLDRWSARRGPAIQYEKANA
jgi:ribose/xylose/arabinose/galactoside ABC-type transport system permease subunit